MPKIALVNGVMLVQSHVDIAESFAAVAFLWAKNQFHLLAVLVLLGLLNSHFLFNSREFILEFALQTGYKKGVVCNFQVRKQLSVKERDVDRFSQSRGKLKFDVSWLQFKCLRFGVTVDSLTD